MIYLILLVKICASEKMHRVHMSRELRKKLFYLLDMCFLSLLLGKNIVTPYLLWCWKLAAGYLKSILMKCSCTPTKHTPVINRPPTVSVRFSSKKTHTYCIGQGIRERKAEVPQNPRQRKLMSQQQQDTEADTHSPKWTSKPLVFFRLIVDSVVDANKLVDSPPIYLC